MAWTIGEVLDSAFRAFARNWVTVVVAYLIMIAIGMSPMLLWAAVSIVPLILHGEKAPLFDDPASVGVFAGSAVLAFLGTALLMILFAPAMTRIALAAARNQRPRIAEAFDFRRAGTMIGAGFLGGLVVIAGSILLVVPGIIAAVGLSFVSFFVVDTQLGALDSLGASWTATRGHRLHLFGLVLLALAVNLAVRMVLGVTVLLAPLGLVWVVVSTPLWTLVMATVYERIRPAPPASDELLLSA